MKRYFAIVHTFKLLLLYFKVVLMGKKRIKGYVYREIGNHPIVGCNHFKGYEIINPIINKVIYREVKDWGYIGDGFRSYQPDKYKIVSRFFPKNIIKK